MLTDGRTTDAGVTGILIANLGAFGSGELKTNIIFTLSKQSKQGHYSEEQSKQGHFWLKHIEKYFRAKLNEE